jgi:hypothetical protein
MGSSAAAPSSARVSSGSARSAEFPRRDPCNRLEALRWDALKVQKPAPDDAIVIRHDEKKAAWRRRLLATHAGAAVHANTWLLGSVSVDRGLCGLRSGAACAARNADASRGGRRDDRAAASDARARPASADRRTRTCRTGRLGLSHRDHRSHAYKSNSKSLDHFDFSEG